MHRFILLALMMAAPFVTGCDPCRTVFDKAEQCDDLAEGVNVAAAVAACHAEIDGLSRTDAESVECLFNCWGTQPTCTLYFEKVYYSCDCELRCGVPCTE